MDNHVNHSLVVPQISLEMETLCPEERIVLLESISHLHPAREVRETATQAAKSIRGTERLLLRLDKVMARANGESDPDTPQTPSIASRQRSLLAELSHEVKNGLHAILNIGIFLAEEIEDSPAKDFVKTLTDVSEDLLQSTEHYLALSAAGATGSQSRLESFCMQQLIREATQMFACAARSKNLCLRTETGEALPVTVTSNRFVIASTLRNLLSNAIKFSSEGEVVIRVNGKRTREAFQIVLEVVDQGPGIPEKWKEQVFQPFRALGNAESTSLGGGFGLAMVRDLLKHIGGTIHAKDNQPRGTIFRVTFPVDCHWPSPRHSADNYAVTT